MIKLSLLRLAYKRLSSRPGLTLVFVLAHALTVAVMAAVPVYVDAVALQILRREMDQKTETQGAPAFAVRLYAMPRYGEPMTLEEADYAREWIGDTLSRSVGLPIRSQYGQSESPVFYFRGEPGGTTYDPRRILSPMQVALVRDVAQHIRVLEGEAFGQVADDSALHVWMEAQLAERLGLQAGERYGLADPADRGAAVIPVRVVGIWEAVDPGDRLFWPERPTRLLEGKLLTTEEQYRTFIYPARAEMTYYHLWYYVLDDTEMSFSRAHEYVATLQSIERSVSQRLPAGRMDLSPMPELERGLARKGSLEAVLLNLSLPFLVVLIYFIGAVSAIQSAFQRREVAMLASRGASASQILSTRAAELSLLLLVATPLGVAAGLLLARVIGHARGFLDFSGAAPVRVHLASVDGRLVALGMASSALAYLLPGASPARHSIVAHERWSARRSSATHASRRMLLAFLLVATAYGFHRLRATGALHLVSWQGADRWADPIRLLAPGLFLVSATLLASELFVAVIRIAALVARLWPRVAAYLGLLTLGREGEAYRRPIFLMAICLAFGVFFASLAASAEVWLVDRWQHAVGADLVLKLDVGYGDLGAPEDATAVTGAAWLPISDYEAIEGVTHAARVAAYTAKVSGGVGEAGRGVAGFRLLGVDPADFGRVAYFRQDYASFSLGDLLNRLTARPDGLLLPAELAERLCLGLGDRVVLDVQVTGDVVQPVPFALVGTFDHFPTMVDALTRVAVVNLSYLETETGGPRLYDVWLRLAPAADTESILSGVRRLGVKPLPLSDLRDHLRREEGRLERAGLYGMLSVCFLAGALFAGLGLLVHSYAALTGQSLRFAVWQAMGLHRAELMAAVSVEYLLVLGYGMASGLGVGLAAALIYVPLYRLIEGEGPPVPPFLPVVDWRGAGILAALMALYLAGIEVLIVTRLARTKVFEALRMGEKA